MKETRKRVSIFLLLAATIPFAAHAQQEKLTEKEIESNIVRNYFADNRQEVESGRLDYLIPESYKKSYPASLGYNLDIFEKVKTLRRYFLQEYIPDPSPEVPEQFQYQKTISGAEQERTIEEESAEKLYKEQSDPLYFEKSRESFKEEFNKRMQERNFKK
ncbi:hypothetical protein [Dyadobacter psychrotolerans]|jgi:hypothetical protein|uniref:Uncharacterized protein n=1 Tax=Dyadobacter psychrotolerans TaxID=2541721 RepID=A0A4R5DDQ0_9BACT|nr:hypothetical protein [Dyadobacter psychrotolerans]TDE09814.1 hypothetical protein E0F88_29940 [Dyadobacter psychrotolerans]